ncbi:unnamed protein product [Urochloa humidicola]
MTSTGTLHRLAACIPGGAAPMSSFGRSTSSLSDRFHSTPRLVRLHHAALNASGFEGCQRQPLRDLGPLPPPHPPHPPRRRHIIILLPVAAATTLGSIAGTVAPSHAAEF